MYEVKCWTLTLGLLVTPLHPSLYIFCNIFVPFIFYFTCTQKARRHSLLNLFFWTAGWNTTASVIHVQIVANCRVTHLWDQPTGIVTQLVSGKKKVFNPVDYWASGRRCNSNTLFKRGETSLCSTPEPRASVQWAERLVCKFSRKFIIRKVLEQLRAKP